MISCLNTGSLYAVTVDMTTPLNRGGGGGGVKVEVCIRSVLHSAINIPGIDRNALAKRHRGQSGSLSIVSNTTVYRGCVQILSFVFKCRNGIASKYLSDLIKPYAPLRVLRSADHLLLAVPRAKLNRQG